MEKLTMRSLGFALLMIVSAAGLQAQGVTFQVTSLPSRLQKDGTAESAGEIALTAISNGTIPANSNIDLVYSADVANNAADSQDKIDIANNLACTKKSACPNETPADTTKAATLKDGKTLRLHFATAQSFAPGDQIYISRIRVNASALAAGGRVTVTIAGLSSDPEKNPITIANPERNVGVVHDAATEAK